MLSRHGPASGHSTQSAFVSIKGRRPGRQWASSAFVSNTHFSPPTGISRTTSPLACLRSLLCAPAWLRCVRHVHLPDSAGQHGGADVARHRLWFRCQRLGAGFLRTLSRRRLVTRCAGSPFLLPTRHFRKGDLLATTFTGWGVLREEIARRHCGFAHRIHDVLDLQKIRCGKLRESRDRSQA